MKDKIYMIILMVAETAFDKTKHLFMIKTQPNIYTRNVPGQN